VGGRHQPLATLNSGHCVTGWMGPTGGLDSCRKSPSHHLWSPKPSRALGVAIPTTLLHYYQV